MFGFFERLKTHLTPARLLAVAGLATALAAQSGAPRELTRAAELALHLVAILL